MSYMDTILLYQAIKNPYCNFFVTRDNLLIKMWNRIMTGFQNFEVINRKTFISTLENESGVTKKNR